VVLLLAAAVLPRDVYGQTSKSNGALASESFDVASIRRNTSTSPNSSIRGLPGGRFVATNATVLDLIRFAFAIPPYEIIGDDRVPRTLRDVRFDVLATAARDVPLPTRSVGPMNRMVQKLLADRFGLVSRTEMREQQVYVLTLARDDGRLGPQLRRSEIDCADQRADPNRPPPQNAQQAMSCAIVNRGGQLRARGHTMPQFADHLARQFQKPVVDETGLAGPYEIELNASFEGLIPSNGIPPPRTGPLPQAPDPSPFPSLFTALPEQLGLRLQSQRRPVPVLAVESIRPPAEN
jgi:uncharacterized protein (TIGR03435 family)